MKSKPLPPLGNLEKRVTDKREEEEEEEEEVEMKELVASMEEDKNYCGDPSNISKCVTIFSIYVFI